LKDSLSAVDEHRLKEKVGEAFLRAELKDRIRRGSIWDAKYYRKTPQKSMLAKKESVYQIGSHDAQRKMQEKLENWGTS